MNKQARFFFCYCEQLLYQLALAYELSTEDTEDCVQEAWSTLLERLPNFEPDENRASFPTWVFHIVRSKAIDILRHRKRQPNLLDPERLDYFVGTTTERINHVEEEELLARALEQLEKVLSPVSYEVFTLRHVENLSVAEVAQRLDLRVKQVRDYCHRALTQFKKIDLWFNI